MPATLRNKIGNLGEGEKNVTLAPEYDGVLPGDNLLTASMIAAGAIVERGTNSNGSFIKYENGLMFAWHTGSTIGASTGTQFWTFPETFTDMYWVQASSVNWRGGDNSNYHYSDGHVGGRNGITSLGDYAAQGQIKAYFRTQAQDGGNPTNSIRPIYFAMGAWK